MTFPGEHLNAKLAHPSLLRMLISYDGDTGSLTWLRRSPDLFKSERDCKAWNTMYSGKSAASKGNPRYLRCTIFDRKYLAHRVAWAIAYGEWPDLYVDHVNGDGFDNRLSNLRLADASENNFNQKLRYNNLSGLKGVSFDPRRGCWRARIQAGHKQRWLGYFPSADAAHDAYAKAAQKTFGDFARLQ